jgi:hypothetical protein
VAALKTTTLIAGSRQERNMHALEVIKNTCADALNDDDATADASFRAVVDPGSVLEMATIIESLLGYVEKVDDLTARELATEVRHRITGRVGADGAV